MHKMKGKAKNPLIYHSSLKENVLINNFMLILWLKKYIYI